MVTMSAALQRNWQMMKQDWPLVSTAVLCNPVLVLHAMNGLLSYLDPAGMSNPLFDTQVNPHLDVHADENFARVFTAVIVMAQLAAYRSFRNDGRKS
ncbi:hypothetical protein RBB50_008305 [Rhinocladiella similis]